MSLAEVQFEILTPCDAETVQANIAHALSLDLPEADAEPLKRLTIIANGPSAREAPLHGPTLAVNGALSLFMNTGRLPTYWAACDPQELVADFLPARPPKAITYLVASKCHPKVFEKLRGCDVRLWHIDDQPLPEDTRAVPVASSVTLCITSLMRRLGYRAFDFYGWDGCYEEIASGVIAHHGSDATLSRYPEDTLTVFVGATATAEGFTGGRPFRTTRTWAAEAQDAMLQLQMGDYEVTIHGDGFIKARWGLIREQRTTAAAGA